MSYQTDIRAALRSILRSSGLLADTNIAWQGIDFTRPTDQAWAKETLIPTSARLKTMNAPQGVVQEDFIYQLSFFDRADRGMKDLEALVDGAVAAFKPGTSVISGSANAIVERAEKAGPIDEPDWIQIPVSIYLWGQRAN